MELRPVDEAVNKRFRVRCQQSFPAVDTHSHPVPNRPCVRQEVGKVWTSPVSSAVESIHQSAGPLELNREEVGSRNVLASALDAALVSATSDYLIAPEVEAGFIRFAIQEIKVVLTDKVLRRIEWISEPAAATRRPKGSFRRLVRSD